MTTLSTMVGAHGNLDGGPSDSIRTVVLQASSTSLVRPMLVLRQTLQLTGKVRIGSMTPTDDGVVMDIELLRRLDLPSFLMQLPWVTRVVASTVESDQILFCGITLAEDAKPLSDEQLSEALKKA